MPAVATIAAGNRKLQVPCSSDRRHRGQVFVKILTAVELNGKFGFGFEGKLVQPGAWVQPEDLPKPLVALECAGPQGVWRKGQERDVLWILWKWEAEFERWTEVCRAQSPNWDWAETVRRPAWRALHPEAGLYDIEERRKKLAAELMGAIATALKDESRDLRLGVLSSVYQQISCDLVNPE